MHHARRTKDYNSAKNNNYYKVYLCGRNITNLRFADNIHALAEKEQEEL